LNSLPGTAAKEIDVNRALRSVRRRILTPDDSETELSVRKFHVKDEPARELLETVGRTFLRGYAYAAECREPAEAEERLEDLPVRFRGFGYEGAAMAFAVRDGLPLGRHDHIARFLRGHGKDHVYMVYVGVGWAMARLPRVRWPVVNVTDPLLRWLVLDGYGFHQAYFKTERYVHRQYREPAFPWPAEGPRWYADRAIDQGIGRAMWFVGGTDPEEVDRLIGRFPEERHADLYSGAGLAVTYAGGVNESELERLRTLSGPHLPLVAQAAAFAATARAEAGLIVPHNDLATKALCGMPARQAHEAGAAARPAPPYTGDIPPYEVWRRRLAARFGAVERAER
jgi:enediyne biosynthesis protein E3